jgi:hypothetical protein
MFQPLVKDQVRPAVPYPVRTSRWRASPVDAVESTDMLGRRVRRPTSTSTCDSLHSQ